MFLKSFPRRILIACKQRAGSQKECPDFQGWTILAKSTTEASIVHTSLEARGGGGQQACKTSGKSFMPELRGETPCNGRTTNQFPLFLPPSMEPQKSTRNMRGYDTSVMSMYKSRFSELYFRGCDAWKAIPEPGAPWNTKRMYCDSPSLSRATLDRLFRITSEKVSHQTRRALISLSKGHEEVDASAWNGVFVHHGQKNLESARGDYNKNKTVKRKEMEKHFDGGMELERGDFESL